MPMPPQPERWRLWAVTSFNLWKRGSFRRLRSPSQRPGLLRIPLRRVSLRLFTCFDLMLWRQLPVANFADRGYANLKIWHLPRTHWEQRSAASLVFEWNEYQVTRAKTRPERAIHALVRHSLQRETKWEYERHVFQPSDKTQKRIIALLFKD